MTTENEEIIPIVRDINTLLLLDTYQDMTDEEIELIIEYKVNERVNSIEVQSRIKIVDDAMSEITETNANSCKQAIDMLNSILNRPLELTGV